MRLFARQLTETADARADGSKSSGQHVDGVQEERGRRDKGRVPE